MAKFEIEGIVLGVPDSMLNNTLTRKLSSGDYEGNEARATRMRVKSGQRVLELGGGIGYISSISAQLTDPSNIVLVEANPALLPVIKNNLKRNNASDVSILHGAVVNDIDAKDSVLFRLGRVFWGSSLASPDTPEGEIVEVPAVGFHQLMKSHQPHVVIMDIEGAEEHLFDRPWPNVVRQVIMELHPKKYEASAIKRIVDCMSESGLTYDPACSRGTLLAFRRV